MIKVIVENLHATWAAGNVVRIKDAESIDGISPSVIAVVVAKLANIFPPTATGVQVQQL